MAKKSMSLGDYCSCCTSWSGLIHVSAGVGIGFLLVHYFSLTDLALYGWGLTVVGLLGHFVGKKGWK